MTVTKIYKQNGAILVEVTGKDPVYLNTDDTRLYFSGEGFLILDGQLGRTYDLGDFSRITTKSGSTFGTYAECKIYLMALLEPTFGTSVTEGVFSRKIVEMNTLETYFKTTYYDADDAVFQVQVIKEGVAPSESVDATKTLEITNTYG